MNALKTLACLIPFIALVGCSKNPAENVPKADVTAPASTSATTESAPSAGAKSYAFGPNGSTIEFVGSKVTGSHKGGFKQFAGELQVAGGKVADKGNKVVIDTTSLWSDNERLTGHLKSPDFFDVAKHPAAVFETISISPNATNSTVTGNLTLHGITKQIAFPANIKVSDESVDVAAEFFINRFDFEMKYPGKADDLIRKEVVLKLNIKAVPGKADFKPIGQTQQTASTR
jgi:polyisoprenoid-binding protein YceI